MKKIVLILLIYSGLVSAQTPYAERSEPQQKIKTGVGIAFTGEDAMWGYSMFTQYHYFLNSNISIAPGLVVSHFRDDQEHVLRNAQAEALELAVHFHMLESETISFEIGGGANLRYFHWSVATDLSESYTFDDQLIRAGDKATFDHFTAGYQLSVGFGYWINENLRLHFVEVLQNDNRSNTTWDSRIGLMINI